MSETVDDLAARSGIGLQDLISLIEDEDLQEASLGEAYLGRRGADVLAHLHGWHLQFMEWLRAEAAGEDVVMPAPGFTWDDLRAYNDALYERFRHLSYAAIKDLVLASHHHMFDALRTLPSAGLRDPAAHPWAGGPLLDIADECSGKHYDWGVERITEALREE
jgi:hypothetical protein